MCICNADLRGETFSRIKIHERRNSTHAHGDKTDWKLLKKSLNSFNNTELDDALDNFATKNYESRKYLPTNKRTENVENILNFHITETISMRLKSSKNSSKFFIIFTQNYLRVIFSLTHSLITTTIMQ